MDDKTLLHSLLGSDMPGGRGGGGGGPRVLIKRTHQSKIREKKYREKTILQGRKWLEVQLGL